MVQVYPGHLIYYKQEPFVYMAEPNVENVKAFIADYCTQQRVQMVSDDWFIWSLNTILSREVLASANKATGGTYSQPGAGGSYVNTDPRIAIAGQVPVAINRKCFEG